MFKYSAPYALTTLILTTLFAGTGCSNDTTPAASSAEPQATSTENVAVLFDTTLGQFTVELDADKAPVTVENFLQYVDDGFYAGTIFHRVINNFMVQGGGFTADMQQKAARPAIANEANNGLTNVTGSIAMARLPSPHSASSQFFINVADNASLNHRGETPAGWGYAVFGQVTEGMDVINAIKMVPTGYSGRYGDVPLEPIVINSVTRVGL